MARILGHRLLQIKCFYGNVAPRAIRAGVLEIFAREPVICNGAAAAVFQNQQKESVCRRFVSSFGPVVDRFFDLRRGVLSSRCRSLRIQRNCRRCIRGDLRLSCIQRVVVIIDGERIISTSKVRRDKVKTSCEEKQRKNWLKKTNLGQAVEEAARSPRTGKAAQGKTAMMSKAGQ